MQENCAKDTVNNSSREAMATEHNKTVQNTSLTINSPEMNTGTNQSENLASPLNLVERDKEARVSIKGASMELKRALGEVDAESMEQRILKLASSLCTTNRLAVVVFSQDNKGYLVKCTGKSKEKPNFYGLEVMRLAMERSQTTPADNSKDPL